MEPSVPYKRTPKETLRMVVEELMGNRKLHLVEELFHSEFKNYSPAPGYSYDREGIRNFFADIFNAFPNDFNVQCTHLMGENNLAAARFIITGIHERRFINIDPTQQRLRLPVISIVRVKEEGADSKPKIIQRWSLQDNLDAMQQLGVL